jgi:hypothetical protein
MAEVLSDGIDIRLVIGLKCDISHSLPVPINRTG